MGIAFNTDTNEVYICFNNSPPSNVIGQFQQNVLPLAVPNPEPNPVPVNLPIKQNIINQLYHIINEVNANYPKYYIINDLNSVINNIILKL
jgi:hypothetical protein